MTDDASAEKTPHQEIVELERLLAEKRQALEREGDTTPEREREAFREVFRESFGEHLNPQRTLQPLPATLAPGELAGHADALKEKAREEQIEHLVGIAFTKGVRAAADVARHATPWLMDELHDRLQDRYYEHLIQARQLKQL